MEESKKAVCQLCFQTFDPSDGHECNGHVLKAHALKIKNDKIEDAVFMARRMLMLHGTVAEKILCFKAFKKRHKKKPRKPRR